MTLRPLFFISMSRFNKLFIHNFDGPHFFKPGFIATTSITENCCFLLRLIYQLFQEVISLSLNFESRHHFCQRITEPEASPWIVFRHKSATLWSGNELKRLFVNVWQWWTAPTLQPNLKIIQCLEKEIIRRIKSEELFMKHIIQC